MQWKTVTLRVSEYGDIEFAGKILSCRRDTRGYYSIGLTVHRLVAQAFLGEAPKDGQKYVVDHIDGNPSNNRASNLQWLTPKENALKGQKVRPRALSREQVKEIWGLKPKSSQTLASLAKEFGVSYACVRAIRAGINWSGNRPSNNTKLTPQQVEIVRKWKPPLPTAAQLGRKYHVSQTTIRNIWHGLY